MRLILYLSVPLFLLLLLFPFNSCNVASDNTSDADKNIKRELDFSILSRDDSLVSGRLTYRYAGSEIEIPIEETHLKEIQNSLEIESYKSISSRSDFFKCAFLNYCLHSEGKNHCFIYIGFNTENKKEIALDWYFEKRKTLGSNCYSSTRIFGGSYLITLRDDALYYLLLDLAQKTQQKVDNEASLQNIELCK